MIKEALYIELFHSCNASRTNVNVIENQKLAGLYIIVSFGFYFTESNSGKEFVMHKNADFLYNPDRRIDLIFPRMMIKHGGEVVTTHLKCVLCGPCETHYCFTNFKWQEQFTSKVLLKNVFYDGIATI